MKYRDQHSIHPWEIKESEILVSTGFFKLRKDKVYMPHIKEDKPAFIAEHYDWVNVVAITPQEEIVFTKQYRHGIQRVCLEIPGGMMEKDDTSPGEAIKRELMEETGYSGDHIQSLGKISPNPAFQNNFVHPFLMKGVTRMGDQNLDETEEIEVILIPKKEIPSLIESGEISQLFTIASLYLAFHIHHHEQDA